MRVILTGGGSGGHFYPLIAVARSLKSQAGSQKILNLELLYFSDDPYDAKILGEEGIRFMKIPAGKIRRYFSFQNFIDPFKTFWGVVKAFWLIFLNYPDVIFAKGGYASFPTLFVGRFLGIPIVIHETDTVPGKVTLWASRFARRIAISFPEAAKYFPKDMAALTGNPVRREIIGGSVEEAIEIFNLEEKIPVVLVTGGSQGARKINEIILDILPELLEFSQVIHQSGVKNFDENKLRAGIVLEKSSFPGRYHPQAFLNERQTRNALRAANLIIARAGGSNIFEIALSGNPSILIPLPTSAQDHQRENAYAYARAGAAVVMEEENLTKNLFLREIKKLLEDSGQRDKMTAAARAFAKPDAADKIALEIINLTVAHS